LGYLLGIAALAVCRLVPGVTMPNASWRDPVELLLQRILRNTAVLLSAGLASACADTHTTERDGSAHSNNEPDGSAPSDNRPDGSAPSDNKPDGSAPSDNKPDGSAPSDNKPDGSALSGIDAGPLKPVGPALSCIEGNTTFTYLPVRVDKLKLAEAFDYVALRQRDAFGPVALDSAPDQAAEHWTNTLFHIVTETGEACATATGARCAEQVAKHPEELVITSPCPMGCVERSFVTTRGDQVQRWAGSARIQTLLGTIDTPDEAVMIAAMKGYTVRCGVANEGSVTATPAGYEIIATELTKTCPITQAQVRLAVSSDGALTTLESVTLQPSNGCAGRRPVGLLSPSQSSDPVLVGDYLARSAHLEGASVIAFERMADELAALGAPRALIEAALAARDDELRHTRVMGDLARARGGEPPAVSVADASPRTAEEIALENAVEGCVRETFGALLGGYQALCAQDLEVRAAMHEIAEDEARHAALSHRVHGWLMGRLDADARTRVRHAQERAIFALAAEQRALLPKALRRKLGLPRPGVARALLEQLNRSLWQSPLESEPKRILG
jgi:hypothetical protein